MKILAKHFIQVRPDEEVRLVAREYFITRLPALTIVVIGYVAWWFFLYVFVSWGGWGIGGWLTGMILVLGYGVRGWLVWQNDCCVVTNQRLIDIEKHGFFNTTVREVVWPTVYDVQYNQRGFWATICGYGAVTVFVKNGRPIVLQHIYEPAVIRDILSEYVPTLH